MSVLSVLSVRKWGLCSVQHGSVFSMEASVHFSTISCSVYELVFSSAHSDYQRPSLLSVREYRGFVFNTARFCVQYRSLCSVEHGFVFNTGACVQLSTVASVRSAAERAGTDGVVREGAGVTKSRGGWYCGIGRNRERYELWPMLGAIG